jgi:hypothetical protein
MSLPHDFLSLRNFERAWERLLNGSNLQYKRLFAHLFPSYNISADANLKELIERIRRNHYSPSTPTTIYYPKSSRILRPITLLSISDQVVYQAIANYIAAKFFRSLARNYGVRTFGAQFAGSRSSFFYRPWKKAYRSFNYAIRRFYFRGNTVIADFDLVSFFDLIDHKILRRILEKRIKNGEILDLLSECLEKWTSGNSSAYVRGHGIPQGPEPSAFLAEIILSDFDRAGYRNVVYLRYVDDIKLLGKDFPPVRRALLRLDLQAKRLGLVPQSQKIEIRRVTDIAGQLKSVPSNIAGATAPQKTRPLTKSTIHRLRRMLKNSVLRTKGDVAVINETHFKFALHRLPPSRQILRLIRPLFRSRPDLSGVLGRFAGRFPNARTAVSVLGGALKSDPVFDAAGGDYVLALDRRVGSPGPRRLRKLVTGLIVKSEEKSVLLDVPCKLYSYKRSANAYMITSLKTEPSALAVGQLINLLCIEPLHRSIKPITLLPVLRRLASRAADDDVCRYCTYLMLSELKRRPATPGFAGALMLKYLGWSTPLVKISLLSNFFRDFFGLKSNVDWDRLLGKRAHAEAQRRAIILRGRWAGSPSILVTILDNFNDLLLQRLSMKHQKLAKPFKKAAGKNKIPDYGAWLKHPFVPTLLPIASPILIGCHDLRIRADIAHATQKKTGRFTRPVSYYEKDGLLKQMKIAYREMLSLWSTL